jgi:hypothetical protein
VSDDEVVADRLAARKIGRFLRFGTCTSQNGGGTGARRQLDSGRSAPKSAPIMCVCV